MLNYCKRKGECSKLFFFLYQCIIYKSFYDLYVMILIVKPYFKVYGFDLLNHILKFMVLIC